MKKRIIKRYLTQVIVFTLVYFLLIFAVDMAGGGRIVEYIDGRYSYRLANFVMGMKYPLAVMVYVLVLVILSVVQVFKLARLLGIASESIAEENPVVCGKKCPEELKDFGMQLKEVRQRAEANEQARKSAEQQKNDLIVYLAHDLKTPLTSVIGYLSLLQESPDIPAEQRAKYVGIALDKAYRLEQLINEFFDITRLNLSTVLMQKTHFNLSILLTQVISEFYPMLEEKHLTVASEIPQEIRVYADADKLARVFDNLLRNAVSYSNEGTAIRMRAFLSGDNAIVLVQNEGEEIAPEQLAHIFDKFYRLDAARQSRFGGAGLGLAIAKQIMELHGGSIEAASCGRRIEFKLTLPVGE